MKGFPHKYFVRFHLQSGEGNGTPLQCSCLQNPRDGGAWWAAVYGVAQSPTRLTRLSSSSTFSCTSHCRWVISLPNRTARLTCRRANPLAPGRGEGEETEEAPWSSWAGRPFQQVLTGGGSAKRQEDSQEAKARPWGRAQAPPQGSAESLGSFQNGPPQATEDVRIFHLGEGHVCCPQGAHREPTTAVWAEGPGARPPVTQSPARLGGSAHAGKLRSARVAGPCPTAQSTGSSRPGYWSVQTFPSPRDLSNPGIEPTSLATHADSLPAEPPGNPFT